MTAIKEELHELIEVTSDEQLLHAVKVILSSQNRKQEASIEKNEEDEPQKIILPNGQAAYITPGNPSVDASDLFGIWKDTPEIMEKLRKTAWGGRA